MTYAFPLTTTCLVGRRRPRRFRVGLRRWPHGQDSYGLLNRFPYRRECFWTLMMHLLEGCHGVLLSVVELEPVKGIEPPTRDLRNRRSAI